MSRKTFSPDSDDALRRAVEERKKRESAREIAEGAGVSYETVYSLLRRQKISPRSRQRLSDYVRAPAPPPAAVPPGADSPGAWWARMDEARKQLGSMARIADELASMARVTESTVGGLLEAGVLTGATTPAGAAPGYPRQVITTPEQDAQAAREAEAGRAQYEREQEEQRQRDEERRRRRKGA